MAPPVIGSRGMTAGEVTRVVATIIDAMPQWRDVDQRQVRLN